MGAKKHKKESKKKKHRSRSRSPIDEEKERRRHRRHKDRKKDRSPDVEEVPVDSHLQAASDSDERSRSSSVSRDRRLREERRRERDDRDKSPELDRVVDRSPVAASSSNQESLSIDETNRIRAKLGLKPLEVNEQPADDGKLKDDLGEFYHKPAVNVTEQKKSEKLREKLQVRKEKRQLEQRMKTTLLAEGSDEEDASAWVNKSRDIEKQKKEAAKRAAMLDEMDEVFGVSALVAEEEASTKQNSYTADHLKGLRVAHDMNNIEEESTVILTLADAQVLADEPEDVLVNVNMVDDDRYKKNQEEIKKARKGYQAYDDEEDIRAAALGYKKPVLSKYDDEEKAGPSRGFVIGDEDAIEAKRFKEMMRRANLMEGGERRLESLTTMPLTIASDYYNDDEVQAKFKKVKKKGKLRKKAKMEPIDVDDYDPAQAPLETDDTEVKPELIKLEVDEDEVEPDSELQVALARARRMRQTEELARVLPKVEDILASVKEESSPSPVPGDSCMVLDATAEFCRTLGDIPTYGQAGNRDHKAEIMDFEEDDGIEAEKPDEPANTAGAWTRIDVNSEKPADLATAGSGGALEAEPALDGGVAGALRLALSKGYLEKAESTRPAPHSAAARLLAAEHYSIEDKTHGEDEKHGRRERGYAGPLQDFREKTNFKPHIKLDYVDDDGRPLCPKEAFRYLSHKFHGKGPGKNKQEKRIKKAVQEGLMKKMSSTDTPLNTLALLQEKQKETSSPYIVLSGLKKDGHN